MLAKAWLCYLALLVALCAGKASASGGCNGCHLAAFSMGFCDGAESGKTMDFMCEHVNVTDDCKMEYTCRRGLKQVVNSLEMTMKGKVGDQDLNVHNEDVCKDIKEKTKDNPDMIAMMMDYGGDEFQCGDEKWVGIKTVKKSVELKGAAKAAWGKSPGPFKIDMTMKVNGDMTDCLRMEGNVVCEQQQRKPKKN